MATLAYNENIVVMALSLVVDLALNSEKSRVYPRYHPRHEGNSLWVFPCLITWRKKSYGWSSLMAKHFKCFELHVEGLKINPQGLLPWLHV